MRRTAPALAALAVLAAPAVLGAPRPAPGRSATSIARILDECRAGGATGWELVDEATRRVHEAYTHHSLWHLWETPAASLARGRGWSAQYNQALAEVLRGLGFEVLVVHAARVRGLGHNPWWQAGHTWLQVTHQGRTLDVCAADVGNRAGRVAFIPTSGVRPVNPWTRGVVSAALAPVVAVQAWRGLAGQRVPRWLYRPFDERL